MGRRLFTTRTGGKCRSWPSDAVHSVDGSECRPAGEAWRRPAYTSVTSSVPDFSLAKRGDGGQRVAPLLA
jgi:hypothetical protein